MTQGAFGFAYATLIAVIILSSFLIIGIPEFFNLTYQTFKTLYKTRRDLSRLYIVSAAARDCEVRLFAFCCLCYGIEHCLVRDIELHLDFDIFLQLVDLA